MAKPSINTTLEDLQRQSAKGGMSGSSARSAGNMMPGPSAIASKPSPASMGGATAGLGANPARTGNPPISAGGYQPITGSPSPSAPLTPRMHSLTKASLTHLDNVGHRHPNHSAIMAHASKGIAAGKMKTPQAPRKFGALGGMAGGGMGGATGNMGGMAPMKPDMDNDGY